MNTKFFFTHLSSIILLIFLSGCAELGPYPVDRKNSSAVATNGSKVPQSRCYQHNKATSESACVRFVEYDDFGNVFSRVQLDETLAAVRATAEKGGIVIVYSRLAT